MGATAVEKTCCPQEVQNPAFSGIVLPHFEQYIDFLGVPELELADHQRAGEHVMQRLLLFREARHDESDPQY